MVGCMGVMVDMHLFIYIDRCNEDITIGKEIDIFLLLWTQNKGHTKNLVVSFYLRAVK